MFFLDAFGLLLWIFLFMPFGFLSMKAELFMYSQVSATRINSNVFLNAFGLLLFIFCSVWTFLWWMFIHNCKSLQLIRLTFFLSVFWCFAHVVVSNRLRVFTPMPFLLFAIHICQSHMGILLYFGDFYYCCSIQNCCRI